ncbi:MAG: glycine--tRNA ligase subunit beta [Fusobacteriaceae bacterium]
MKLLFEIGMEEIPARFLEPALSDLQKNIEKKLQENRIKFDTIKTFGTPRRLIIFAEGLEEKQKDLDVVNMGPIKSVAFGGNGEITNAGIGFAKSQGVNQNDLEIISTPKGEYVAVKKFMKGEETAKIIPEILKSSVLELTFPKSMKWSDKKIKFARPIKWYLALLDSKIINFEIEGITSGNKSRGHRFFGKEFEAENPDDYLKKIRENNVIIDIEERKDLIRKLIDKNCVGENEKVLIGEELLSEVTNLVEYPYPIVGSFNAEFLEVPQDILIISMQVHQRYFPILNRDGKLQPKFVVVRNGIESSEFVKNGNEKVLSARLSDARFFYNEDLKAPFENNIEKLKEVVYQKDLGTIYEKIERVKIIAEKLIVDLKLENKKANIIRTAELCKADLVSHMIGEKEFTKLQGYMGEDYAIRNGEDENVATGIREHYLPRFQGDELPTTSEGMIVGLADRIDTLVGCFGVGLIPTGSKDPFALRRAALGIVNIIAKKNLEFSLEDITKVSLDLFEEKKILKRPKEEIFKEVMDFFNQRIINVFADMGFRKDYIAAVVAVDNKTITEVQAKIETLGKIIGSADFEKFVGLAKRIGNIARECSDFGFDEKLLVHPLEKDLDKFTKNMQEKMKNNLENKKYQEYIKDIVSGVDLIDKYFAEVMILDKDEKIKKNRLSQMKILDEILNKMADFKLID